MENLAPFLNVGQKLIQLLEIQSTNTLNSRQMMFLSQWFNSKGESSYFTYSYFLFSKLFHSSLRPLFNSIWKCDHEFKKFLFTIPWRERLEQHILRYFSSQVILLSLVWFSFLFLACVIWFSVFSMRTFVWLILIRF